MDGSIRYFSMLLMIVMLWVLLVRSERKTVLITGANSGIGLAASKQLASTNQWDVVLLCRSTEKAQTAIKEIKAGCSNVRFKIVDLSDVRSIRSFAETWGSAPIDCLALNAGIQAGDTKTPLLSAQNHELTIATNHIGHFYLMNLLRRNLEASDKGRIVMVASGVHNPDEPGGNVGAAASLGDLAGLKSGLEPPSYMVDGGAYNADKAYKDSKLCNVITTLEMARRLAQQNSTVTCNCMNPGLVPTTGLFRGFNPLFVAVFTFLTRYVFKVAVSEEEAGRRLAYMISSADLRGVNDKYFSGKPGKQEFLPIEPSKEARDAVKAKQLWDYTERLLTYK